MARVDGVLGRRARDVDRASGRGPALLVRVLLEDLAPHVRARDWPRRRRERVDAAEEAKSKRQALHCSIDY